MKNPEFVYLEKSQNWYVLRFLDYDLNKQWRYFAHTKEEALTELERVCKIAKIKEYHLFDHT